MDAITFPPAPVNEPNLTYAPGSPERSALVAELDRMERKEYTLRAHINGRKKSGGGAGCHLCEVAETTLRRLRDELGFGYTETDVDADAALLAEYSDRVPVILIDGREHGYWRVEEPRFRKALERPVRR